MGRYVQLRSVIFTVPHSCSRGGQSCPYYHRRAWASVARLQYFKICERGRAPLAAHMRGSDAPQARASARHSGSAASCSLPVDWPRAKLRRRPPGAPAATEEVRSLGTGCLFAGWCALMRAGVALLAASSKLPVESRIWQLCKGCRVRVKTLCMASA